MPLRWSHAFVHVRSMEQMLDFYTNVLGFEITDQGDVGGKPVTFLSQVETDHHQLAFMESERAESAEDAANRNTNRVAHFAFRVDGLADVKTLHGRLQADGRVKNVSPVTHGNAWSLYFADPEGNGLEVFCDSPWHVRQPQGGAWDPTASDENIHHETQQAFATADGFGPIADYYHERANHLAARASGTEVRAGRQREGEREEENA